MPMVKRRTPRPRLPHEECAARAKFAKPQFREAFDAQMDTSELAHSKIHPDRDSEYLKWLRFQPCVIKGKTNNRTGVVHICWSPEYRTGFFLSDPMHTGKAYSGRLKRSDRGAIPGCRHFHREAESNMDRADADYDIDRFVLADEYYARFEQERRP